MKIELSYLVQDKIKYSSLKIRNWIKSVVEAEGKRPGEIQIIFTSNEHLLEINRNFLRHNYFTDVVTFSNNIRSFIHGEIYISLEQVKLNARKYKTSFDQEILRVIIHGVLHLIGYRDENDEERKLMTSKEDTYILRGESLHGL